MILALVTDKANGKISVKTVAGTETDLELPDAVYGFINVGDMIDLDDIKKER